MIFCCYTKFGQGYTAMCCAICLTCKTLILKLFTNYKCWYFELPLIFKTNYSKCVIFSFYFPHYNSIHPLPTSADAAKASVKFKVANESLFLVTSILVVTQIPLLSTAHQTTIAAILYEMNSRFAVWFDSCTVARVSAVSSTLKHINDIIKSNCDMSHFGYYSF